MARRDHKQRWKDHTASAPTPRHFDKFNAAFTDGYVTHLTMGQATQHVNFHHTSIHMITP